MPQEPDRGRVRVAAVNGVACGLLGFGTAVLTRCVFMVDSPPVGRGEWAGIAALGGIIGVVAAWSGYQRPPSGPPSATRR